MQYTRIVAVSIVLATFGATGAQAQNLSQNPAPAEFPPASFTGKQYVDSRGCVFIRAGIDGNVTWVPRVGRNRKQICGARPTLAGAAPAAATVQTAPAAAPVQITPRATQPAPAVATPTPRRPASQPQATPRRQTQTAAPVPRRTAPKPSAAPKPTVIAPKPRQTAPAATTPTVPRGGTDRCPNASAFSQRYINDGSRFPVRCGPQAEPPVTRPGGQSSLGSGGGEQRILPAHLLEDRRQASVVRVPEGYDPVWTDGRLNPKRAEQSVNGYVEGQFSWTNTVPRRSTSNARPQRIKTPAIVSNGPVSTKAYRTKIVSRKAMLPQREVAKTEVAKAPRKTAGVYVQVGLYGVEANAQSSAQKMARTGFPTRMGVLTRGGKSYRVVLAGPFASETDAKQALAAARRAGFTDAYLRN